MSWTLRVFLGRENSRVVRLNRHAPLYAPLAHRAYDCVAYFYRSSHVSSSFNEQGRASSLVSDRLRNGLIRRLHKRPTRRIDRSPSAGRANERGSERPVDRSIDRSISRRLRSSKSRVPLSYRSGHSDVIMIRRTAAPPLSGPFPLRRPISRPVF